MYLCVCIYDNDIIYYIMVYGMIMMVACGMCTHVIYTEVNM